MSNSLKKGNILIAEPTILNDKSFNRSVIFLTEHNKEGSVGFILNKPSNYTIDELLPELNYCKHKVYNGGPVSIDNLYFIHKLPELIPNSIHIKDDIFWAGDFNIVKELLEEDRIPSDKIRFFLGYTGWSSNQLSTEMKESNSWMVKKNEYPNILSVASTSFWKNELIKSGGDYQIWANAPEDPNMN